MKGGPINPNLCRMLNTRRELISISHFKNRHTLASNQMEVKVVEYNLKWPTMFEEEAKKIREILGNDLVAIHHIGSTAVPSLKAKPIIDILPVVRDISKVDFYNEGFEKLGYQPKGEFGITGRRYFRKGLKKRTHQIHIFAESNQQDIIRHLAVRDYLRAHVEEAIKYGELKGRLAEEYPNNIQAYSIGKDLFVKELERKALEWYKS